MKRIIHFSLILAIMIVLAGCNNAKPTHQGTINEGAFPTESVKDEKTNPKADTTNNSEITSLNIDGLISEEGISEDSAVVMDDSKLTFERLDDSTRLELKDSFITAWNSGDWSISTGKNAVGDETLYDVMFLKGKGDPFSDYYVLVYASIHLSERFRSDGSSYYMMDANGKGDPLYDKYMFCGFDAEKPYLFLDLNDLYDDYEDALNGLKPFCGNTLTSVFSKDDRAELIAAVSDNAGGNEIYDNMLNQLKHGRFDEAQQTYYKATNLTNTQSRKCLILLAKYELLFNEIVPIQALVDVSGTFSLDSYTLNSWKDENSENNDDLIIFIEYRCKTTHPVMGSKTYYDSKTIPIRIDVENRSFSKR